MLPTVRPVLERSAPSVAIPRVAWRRYTWPNTTDGVLAVLLCCYRQPFNVLSTQFFRWGSMLSIYRPCFKCLYRKLDRMGQSGALYSFLRASAHWSAHRIGTLWELTTKLSINLAVSCICSSWMVFQQISSAASAPIPSYWKPLLGYAGTFGAVEGADGR